MLCTVLCAPEALIKNPFRFFTKSSRSFCKVNISEAGIPLLKEGEKWLSNAEGRRLSGPHTAFWRWVEEIYKRAG
jgi:hypothetical protein